MPQFIGKDGVNGMTSVEAKELLDKYDNFLLDCDGVLWLGSEIIPGVPETLDWLRSVGKKVFFVTNNSTKSRTSYLDKFISMGIKANKSEIFSSAYAAAIYLKEVLNFPNDKKVFVIGMDGIKAELDEENIQHFSNEENKEASLDRSLLNYRPDEQVGAVLVGMDTAISYQKYAQAHQYLLSPNTLFLATNSDSTYPIANTTYPGTGAILVPLITSTNREPTVIGKPNLTALDAIKKKFNLDLSRTCMVGDRLNTDIQFGVSGGLGTLLVLTGVTKLKELETSNILPDYVIQSFPELKY